MVDIKSLQNESKTRYVLQLERLKEKNLDTKEIESTVESTVRHLKNRVQSLVIYGEPQSGKTEMMICLASRLLDEGHKCVVILINDSLDLLDQNETRFRLSQMSPSPKTLNEVNQHKEVIHQSNLVVFCKKNPNDLEKLIQALRKIKSVVVIDDEADFATPNSKINSKTAKNQTTINRKVSELVNFNSNGVWIGVTATPARLDLNETLNNDAKAWVQFKPHKAYVGHEIFFPLDTTKSLEFSLIKLPGQFDQKAAIQRALARFIVNVASRNCQLSKSEEINYSMVIHTSGKKEEHKDDREVVDKWFQSLEYSTDKNHQKIYDELESYALKLHPGRENEILKYVYANRQRYTIRTVNSDSDRTTENIKSATSPQSPFTVAIGGNIISRGVTFDNLLTLFFTRSSTGKIQQDTYIQRARMFGNRLPYLRDFELHVSDSLYDDWHRLFMLHGLALSSLQSGDPIWHESARINAAARTSINKQKLSISSGEMLFKKVQLDAKALSLVSTSKYGYKNFNAVYKQIFGEGYLPQYLVDFVNKVKPSGDESLIFHLASDISGQKLADSQDISRPQGFLGGSDERKYPKSVHHFKIVFNSKKEARLLYKYSNSRMGIKFLRMVRS